LQPMPHPLFDLLQQRLTRTRHASTVKANSQVIECQRTPL
jgi:hypothetical protein